ncbi:MAG: hypothetical protein BRC40_16790 [Cyanobacteria bacterium QH_8_48_120]|jgi:hypothetical protein|nr:MAG: hypothetical protein BRC34_07820 [Cyanobacteria bacterium QH_1_48_107]PSO55717.1 MAG: hypothetical protein BRC35_11010 [Cyanobacteria bacterium QH_10_48_56]PSO63547.1 MAG: hypothetical protein BRC39_04115 [Cyanobacteria bacterium QH_7_48_89]PSO64270.1 MAG: hypothetical protein BRC36_06840 [Cyanobacteria bacterium QH_2_48_84]PSO65848.1 MAG: hypothetical protein BRC38_07350 [Cyanobacteria bacterium QH_6_48_35]PSO68638.1 MAG: hypothetical protein BRC40_16790 [Cyanobacteria bacterium QH_8_
MRFPTIAIITISCLFWLVSWIVTPAAVALTEVKLFDLSYQECPPEFTEGVVTSGGAARAANCFLITGKTENNSGKAVVDADVYGRIFDANGNPVMQNRTRVGSIDQIPPGVSDFDLRISVPSNQPTPLKLEQFKASGFSSSVKFRLN